MGGDLPRCEFDVSSLETRLDVAMPGRLEAIPATVERLMGVVDELECARGSEFEIEVALNEALANAVEHGCRGDEQKQVEITVMCDEARGILIIVRDPGEGFDPASVPNPVVGQRVFSSHGRGIFLINRLMDEVEYQRGGTEIWMRKGPRSPAEAELEASRGEE